MLCWLLMQNLVGVQVGGECTWHLGELCW